MQDNDSFRLIVRRGPQPNQTYDLNKDIITIGRDITNDIVINDPEVSRHHMRLTRTAGGYTVEDLGSTNGTFINGNRLSTLQPLNNGDMIGLGETVTLGYEMSRPMGSGAPEEGGAAGPTLQPSVPQQPQQPQPSYSQPPQQPSYSPQPQQEPEPSGFGGSPYEPQQPAAYGSDYGYAQGGAPQAPPPSGYYEEYEEEGGGRSTTRIVLIGCATLLVFCCCVTIISLYYVEANCMWWDLPVVGDVLDAIGREPPLEYDSCLQRYG